MDEGRIIYPAFFFLPLCDSISNHFSMKIVLFQVDAFPDHQFGGNPAAICPLDEWLTASMLKDRQRQNFHDR